MTSPDVTAWCTAHLGSPVVGEFFGATSMSSVHGLLLADGRRVALKVRAAAPRLLTCAGLHRGLADLVDAPVLLAGPLPLGDDWASAEQWRPEGDPAPAGDTASAFAGLAHRIVDGARRRGPWGTLDPPPPWLHYAHGEPDRIWPPPASHRWDPHRIASDLPPVVVDVARRARARLLAADVPALPPVVGHGDLNGLNTRWVGDHALVHDWDSMVRVPEAVLVGATAVDFVCGPGPGAIASVVQGARLLDAYAVERGTPWSAAECEVAWAAGCWVAAYNAAFEHLHGAPGAVTAALLATADVRLRRAGCGGPSRPDVRGSG